MTDRAPRYPTDSGTVATHLVLPGDTNGHNTAFGGKIMQWMDITASVAAMRHCGTPCVTACVDDLIFARPIRMGDIVILKACVNYTGRTSMEVGVRVDSENPQTHERQHALSGYFTFVAVDAQGKPMAVPPVEARTEPEKRRASAARERQARRVQARASRTKDP